MLISALEDGRQQLALENLNSPLLIKAQTNYSFTAIKGGKYNIKWMANETPKIEQFKRDNPRDLLPEILS